MAHCAEVIQSDGMAHCAGVIQSDGMAVILGLTQNIIANDKRVESL